MTSISHEDILNQRYRIRAFFMLSWVEEYGRDPIQIAGQRASLIRRRSLAMRISQSICAIVAFAAGVSYMLDQSTVAIFLFVFALVASMVAALLVDLIFKQPNEVMNEGSMDFPLCLNWLCEVTGKEPEQLFLMSHDDLRDFATRYLVDCAKEIVAWDRKHHHVPHELTDGREKDRLIDRIQFGHTKLRQLGLADKKYDRYFRMAEKELDETPAAA